MQHHLFGPHFLGAPIVHGVPNWLLLILLAATVWYFFGKRDQTVTEPRKNLFSASDQSERQRESEELKAEVSRLKKENELLQQLLKRELEQRR